ncbi:hypothetical protein [Enterovibrio norvegicus]|uniref:hypothetical protein n=1 Tax=Enterovibrio norvegicus TaxID=188144 RepID=UPI003551ADBB
MSKMNRILLIALALIVAVVQAEEKDVMCSDQAWKLELKSGKLTTIFEHFTVLADGQVEDLIEGFDAPKGNAIMGVKVWASDIEEPPYMVKSIGDQIGFKVTGEIQIYKTGPEQPPRDNPYGYDIQFTPYE